MLAPLAVLADLWQAVLLPKYSKVEALYNAVKERPRIKAYLASDRRLPFSVHWRASRFGEFRS